MVTFDFVTLFSKLIKNCIVLVHSDCSIESADSVYSNFCIKLTAYVSCWVTDLDQGPQLKQFCIPIRAKNEL